MMHSPGADPVLTSMTEPVQPAPWKKVSVIDIAGEAETRRTVAMKATLNCMTIDEDVGIV